MARPQKNNLDYFSHDKDLRNDLKIKALRRKYAHKGYCIYVMMLEHLANCEYLQYEWNELSIELLTSDFDIDATELIEIIEYSIKLKLFDIEFGYIHCPNMLLRHQHVLGDRKSFDPKNSPINKLKRDLLSKSPINSGETQLSESKTGINAHSIVKDSKVQDTKGKDSKVQNSTGKHSTAKNNIVDNFVPLTKLQKEKLTPEELKEYQLQENIFNQLNQ